MNRNEAIAQIVRSVPAADRAKVANRALLVLALPHIPTILASVTAVIVTAF